MDWISKEDFKALRLCNPIPDAVRQEVMERAGWACEGCWASGRLELHHLTYKSDLSDPEALEANLAELVIFGSETADDLVALCRECHEARHRGPGGEYVADPQECESKWDEWNRKVAD